ncbi:hypothetical protein [Anaerotignum sp. MSJ-24]|uniref:hypothetical protein n=1 Tax=Anaerotignum sp. MSJ-24 TaxID=2841521 RepID=UPI001C109296|nr:hypothetical protein [Anaerotignum sp. MSJ-24]MBU5464955.1 hypothetical protein [Anaerotignum sp. MSJ-24]
MKKYITAEQAINIIPEKEYIHTFYSIGVLIGADWERIEIIKKIKSSDILELTGETARKIGHGLAIYNKNTKYLSQVLFVETNEEKLKKLERTIIF